MSAAAGPGGAGADADFFVRLAELHERFGASLPQALGRLSAAREAFDPVLPQQALVEQFHAVLHTLGGSAATFGYRILGQQARMLEQRLRVLTSFDAVDPREWAAWLDWLDVFVAWGLRDPKAAYPGDEAAV